MYVISLRGAHVISELYQNITETLHETISPWKVLNPQTLLPQAKRDLADKLSSA